MNKSAIIEVISELLNASNISPRRVPNREEIARLADAQFRAQELIEKLTGKNFRYDRENISKEIV